jgi:hypothetical protein
MKTIVMLFVILLLLSGLVGVASYWSSAKTLEQQSAVVQPDAFIPKDASQWLETLKQVSAYYVVPKSTTKANDEALASAEAQAKIIKLTDGQLVGIVAASPAKVYVIVPNETVPTVLFAGEGWLAPWIITSVYEDRVVWRDTQNDETVIQYLFDET